MLDRTYDEICKYLKKYRHFMAEMHVAFTDEDMHLTASVLDSDLEAKMEQDPISTSQRLVFLSNSFRAIMAYRISNRLHLKMQANHHDSYQLIAYKMAEESASQTSIEIHPGAEIGRSFVIDHGVNTLIGATSQIGDGCTILQNVVLGARKITYNGEGKRHPTIGNQVQISGGVRILGPVKIGNYVCIGPDCLILEDIPDHSRVKLVKSVMVVKHTL